LAAGRVCPAGSHCRGCHLDACTAGKHGSLTAAASALCYTPLCLPQASFPYIGIADLRAVPLAVLDRLQPVPATFLKQLAGDKELFVELPAGVQRQVGWHAGVLWWGRMLLWNAPVEACLPPLRCILSVSLGLHGLGGPSGWPSVLARFVVAASQYLLPPYTSALPTHRQPSRPTGLGARQEAAAGPRAAAGAGIHVRGGNGAQGAGHG
jgi:hypothetical protein